MCCAYRVAADGAMVWHLDAVNCGPYPKILPLPSTVFLTRSLTREVFPVEWAGLHSAPHVK